MQKICIVPRYPTPLLRDTRLLETTPCSRTANFIFLSLFEKSLRKVTFEKSPFSSLLVPSTCCFVLHRTPFTSFVRLSSALASSHPARHTATVLRAAVHNAGRPRSLRVPRPPSRGRRAQPGRDLAWVANPHFILDSAEVLGAWTDDVCAL